MGKQVKDGRPPEDLLIRPISRSGSDQPTYVANPTNLANPALPRSLLVMLPSCPTWGKNRLPFASVWSCVPKSFGAETYPNFHETEDQFAGSPDGIRDILGVSLVE